MKRCRNTRVSIMDLPELIIFEILLRLPLKRIVMCKCACKTLRHLISSNHFAKLHFARGKGSILLQNVYPGISRMFYLIEPPDINSKYCRCDGIQSGHHQVNMKLDTKLKIPVLYKKGIAEASVLFQGKTQRKRIISLNSRKNRFVVLSSCNGFLCLYSITDYSPRVVCNPVTNEYIDLPIASNAHWHQMYCGFGFCQDTNQYKVLRVRDTDRLAEMHTLGTDSWKSIGFAPFFQYFNKHPTYLNGVLYWISDECNKTDLVVSFDFSDECFRSLPQPPVTRSSRISMGIIADCVCLYGDADGGLIDFWVMKICGIQKSWSKLITITTPILTRWSCLHFHPITCSKCKAFLIIHCSTNLMSYYDPKRGEWKDIKLHGNKFEPRAILYTPSLISLKDVVAAANTKSISTWFKLSGETRSISLVEEACID